MGCIRPATPGFIVTLVAAILLAVVSFCVPYFKSVYFLKAIVSQQGVNGSITFGTLGYCTEFLGNTNCSKPSIGYELDVNALLGVNNKLNIEIPQVAVKWITYALFLHVVALALAVGSAIFGLLAHVREMSMACCSTCVSGFAAAVALLAFIFDLVLFFVAKARINSVGSAQIGNAIWLTLAAWVLLFFSGCFYTFGRCCIADRPSSSGRSWRNKRENDHDKEYTGGVGGIGGNNNYAEQMRLDAVKAEADRKARQKAVESDLPAFSEIQPLTARVDGDNVYLEEPYKDSNPSTPSTTLNGRQGGYVGGGYIRAPPGTRAVDEYYSPSQNNNTYPPQPQPSRQGSTHTTAPSAYSGSTPSPMPQRQPSGYAPTPYGAPATISPPMPPAPVQQFLADSYNNTPPAQQYGHTGGGSSYHTAEPSSYSPYDPYAATQNQYTEPTFNPNTYNNTALLSGAAAGAGTTRYASPPGITNPYMTSPPAQPERSYTLSGDGYGNNSVPPLQEHNSPPYNPYMAAPAETRTAYDAAPRSPGGPRSQPVVLSPPRVDSPPGYDAGVGNVTGNWGKH